MARDSMTPLLLIGGAGLAWWGYTQGWFAGLFGSSAAATASSATSQGTTTTGAAASVASPSGASAPPPPASPSQPIYSGPSLDQMFQALLKAVQADSSNPAMSCAANSLAGFGVTRSTLTRAGGGIVANPPRTIATAPTGGTTPTATPALTGGACSNPVGTYDDFNWYLVNRANVGVSTAPNPPDHTSQITLTDYWTWAAPALQQMMPGLAGGFGRGLGGYAELGAILRRQGGR